MTKKNQQNTLNNFLPSQNIVSQGNGTFTPCGLAFYTAFMLSCARSFYSSLLSCFLGYNFHHTENIFVGVFRPFQLFLVSKLPKFYHKFIFFIYTIIYIYITFTHFRHVFAACRSLQLSVSPGPVYLVTSLISFS